jgi:two-component system invasion response regulator UvrY
MNGKGEKFVPMRQHKIRKALIADSHIVIRTGLKFLLKNYNPDIEIFLAEGLDEVVGLLKTNAIELVITDINIIGGNNTDMVKEIRSSRPEASILIFTSYSEKYYGLPYLQAGVNGFLSKEATEEEIIDALGKIEQGNKYLSPSLQEVMLDSLINMDKRDISPISKLSKRELDVANLLVKGHSTSEISNLLKLQTSTVSTFKTRVFTKLEVSNLVELVAKMSVAIA